MENINWSTIDEATVGAIADPEPGGYACIITDVEDDTSKKYLRIHIDFAEGEFKGDIRRCETEQNFTPSHGSFVETYDQSKRKGLGLTKKFITRLEQTNRGFRWDNRNPKACIGKYIGVILGEEEFWSTKYGEKRKRLYVYDVCSGDELRRKAYTVPPLKKLKTNPTPAAPSVAAPPVDWDNPPQIMKSQPQPYAQYPQQTTFMGAGANPPVPEFVPLPDDEGELPF